MSFVEFRNLMIYKIGSPKIFVYLIIWLMVLVFWYNSSKRLWFISSSNGLFF